MIRHDIQSYMAARIGMPEIVPAPAFPKTWEDDEDEFLASPSCSLFMAESSIPNAGLGMFAGKGFGEKELVDPSPQAIIPLIDINENTHLYSGSVLSNYPWSAWTQGADFESRKTDVLFPSLGMLANSHLGLKNVDQDAKIYYYKNLQKKLVYFEYFVFYNLEYCCPLYEHKVMNIK